MSKYFVVDDIKVASFMSMLLNVDYYTYNNNGKEQYTFERTPNINKAYGNAMRIVNSLK